MSQQPLQVSSQNPPPSSTQSRGKPQYPLDTLQGMINAVLLETGKALRSANNSKDPKTIGYDNERLQAFIPSAVEKFHLALDDLEAEIVRAKAVMNRDLRELRAKKYEMEHPIIKPVDEVTSSNTVRDITDMASSRKNHTSPTHALLSEMPGGDEGLNINAKDHISNSPLIKANYSPIPQPSALEVENQVTNVTVPENSQRQEKPEAYEKAPEDIPSAPDHTADTNAILDTDMENVDIAPTTSEENAGGDLDFDSMFDASGTHGDPDVNFDTFDFNSFGDNQNNDFDQSDGGVDLIGNINDEVTNALQNQEGYPANHTNDFNMMNTTSNAGDIGMQSGDFSNTDDLGMSKADLDLAMGMDAEDSTFDDLLDGMDYGDDGTGGDMAGEFDDAYFRLETEDA